MTRGICLCSGHKIFCHPCSYVVHGTFTITCSNLKRILLLVQGAIAVYSLGMNSDNHHFDLFLMLY